MLVGGILQFVFREKVVSTLDREMYAAIPYYGVKHEYTKAWDETQTYLQCCGVKSYRDWNDNVPESCCREVYPGKVRKLIACVIKLIGPNAVRYRTFTSSNIVCEYCTRR